MNFIEKILTIPEETQTIEFKRLSGEKIVTVYSLNGKIIQKKKTKNNLFELDLSSVKKGVYFVNIVSESRSFNKKIILK